MRKIAVACLMIIMLLPFSATAREITGSGLGSTEAEAKKSALADLSSAIEANVKSDTELITKEAGGKSSVEYKEEIRLKTDLPILGAQFNLSSGKSGITARAMLSTEGSLGLYEEKLKTLSRELNETLSAAASETDKSRQYALYADALTLIDRYEKHKIVAILLGGRGIEELKSSAAEIKAKIRGLETEAESMDIAARVIASGNKMQGIFVYPPLTRASHEVTQFASVFKDRVSAFLKTASSPEAAKYFMRGSYEYSQGGMELSYQVIDAANSDVIATKIVRLLPKAYEGYDYKPKTVSFDRLLHEGIAVESDFRLEVSTNKGGDGLLFKKGEEMEIFVKANRAAYFYMAGHVVKQAEKYSYLLELIENAQGKRRFVYYVNADDVNKWIGIGKFEVVEPFGVESLQVMASTADIIDAVPAYKHDKETGLYIIAKDPEEGAMKVRALRPKKSAVAVSSETVLMFTTMVK